jgi:hypothetical protein
MARRTGSMLYIVNQNAKNVNHLAKIFSQKMQLFAISKPGKFISASPRPNSMSFCERVCKKASGDGA